MTETIALEARCFEALYFAWIDDPTARFDLAWGGGSSTRRGVRLVMRSDDGGPLDEFLCVVKGGRRGYLLPDAADLVVRTADGYVVWNGPAAAWEARGLDPETAEIAAFLDA